MNKEEILKLLLNAEKEWRVLHKLVTEAANAIEPEEKYPGAWTLSPGNNECIDTPVYKTICMKHKTYAIKAVTGSRLLHLYLQCDEQPQGLLLGKAVTEIMEDHKKMMEEAECDT